MADPSVRPVTFATVEAMSEAELFTTLTRALNDAADVEAAPAMEAYQRNQFKYFGIKSPARRAAQKPVLLASQQLSEAELVAFVDRCWSQPQREFQYCAVDVLRKNHATLTTGSITDVHRWITTKSWWDTVDFLGPHIVGSLVKKKPQLTSLMDQWVTDEDTWLTRAAILHQLMYKDETDGDRLFRYCDLRGGDDEFFIRKALGWALRQYARFEPEAVQRYVANNETRLSTLTKREALKHFK